MAQQINLYNPLFLKQEKYFSARAMLPALGIIVFALAAFWVYALVQTREVEGLAAAHRAQLAAQQDRLVKLGDRLAPQGRSKLLESEVLRLEAEVKGRQSIVAALSAGEHGNTAGLSGYFAAFGRTAMPGVWLTGFTVGEGGNDLELRGRALHPDLVPTYLRALNAEATMRGRQVTELKLAAKTAGAPPKPAAGETVRAAAPERYVEFSLNAPLRVREPAKPAAKPQAKGGA